MAKIEDILLRMKIKPSDVRFSDLSKVCAYYFGQARQKDGSHHVYKTPWRGKFRVRVRPEIHRNLAIRASESGVSLNRIVGSKLSR
jgi:predicted HicB family RNase H-like nuclease